MISGYEAEPHTVAALLQQHCGDILAEPDPLVRYTMLSSEQANYDALVSAIKRERGRALAEMHTAGMKQAEIGVVTGLGSRQRVQKLIDAGEDRS